MGSKLNNMLNSFSAKEGSGDASGGSKVEQLLFNFGVHTVKNYDHHPSWEAGYRLVGAGNQIYVLRGGRWVKQPSVIDRQRDALESATLESTRLFIHTQKIRKRKVRKDDADGAYLQAPQNTENRPVGLWAELPQCMWPDDSPAWQLRRPVFPVLTSLYGTDDASFSWDRYSRHQLESQGFWPYYDLSQSLYDFFAFLHTISLECYNIQALR